MEEQLSVYENFRDQEFEVADPDARIRVPNKLIEFAVYKDTDQLPDGVKEGDYKRIAKGTTVKVTDVSIEPAGSQSKRVFAFATSLDGQVRYGWTSSRNFKNQFKNITLGLVKPAHGAGMYSPTAAWKSGNYLGQVSLVRIVDSKLEIEFLTEETAEPYFEMVKAAGEEGVRIVVNSGFRSYPEQKHLWEGYSKGWPGYNLAAKPGRSNHQNGIALDIPVAGGPGNPTYDWLAEYATSYGFVRTVKKEPWHWEYRPESAEKAKKAGEHMV
jgi:hypothetical protein